MQSNWKPSRTKADTVDSIANDSHDMGTIIGTCMLQDVAQSFGQTQAVELATESLVHIEERALDFAVE